MTVEGLILVFAGPSLPAEARPVRPALVWRGPAEAGDGLEACADPRVRAFVLIDGLFDGAPAIRHKELLILMSRGVRVIGGASMGALRACELSRHGMVGIGRIFQAYVRGTLTGDDEVALLHGPAMAGWNALSEPLVNVRATLLCAVQGRVVDVKLARTLLEAAQAVHFSNRTWEAVLAETKTDRREALQRFALWLPANTIDLKRQDALACLRYALTATQAPSPRPPPPATRFTADLARARRQASA